MTRTFKNQKRIAYMAAGLFATSCLMADVAASKKLPPETKVHSIFAQCSAQTKAKASNWDNFSIVEACAQAIVEGGPTVVAKNQKFAGSLKEFWMPEVEANKDKFVKSSQARLDEFVENVEKLTGMHEDNKKAAEESAAALAAQKKQQADNEAKARDLEGQAKAAEGGAKQSAITAANLALREEEGSRKRSEIQIPDYSGHGDKSLKMGLDAKAAHGVYDSKQVAIEALTNFTYADSAARELMVDASKIEENPKFVAALIKVVKEYWNQKERFTEVNEESQLILRELIETVQLIDAANTDLMGKKEEHSKLAATHRANAAKIRSGKPLDEEEKK